MNSTTTFYFLQINNDFKIANKKMDKYCAKSILKLSNQHIYYICNTMVVTSMNLVQYLTDL